MTLKKPFTILVISLTLISLVIAAFVINNMNIQEVNNLTPVLEVKGFNGLRAYENVEYQLLLPPRTPGSKSHETIRNWILSELDRYGWDTQIQTDIYNDVTIYNLIGYHDENSPYILIGAHYDSRFLADHDPDPAIRVQGVPGANDGASGVAILLELARTLPENTRKNIKLVFFDAEDQGRIAGWEWIIGSQSFVENIKSLPEKAVIIDMVGDKDLQVYFESNSDAVLREEIWELAATLGYQDIFVNQIKHSILDDHIPFINKGIPAVVIIDFDYPYWHTAHDTLDKVSKESLAVVGNTLWMWIVKD